MYQFEYKIIKIIVQFSVLILYTSALIWISSPSAVMDLNQWNAAFFNDNFVIFVILFITITVAH